MKHAVLIYYIFYLKGVNYELDEEGNAKIFDSYTMSYHSILKNSKDYYEALRSARKIAANITDTINMSGVEVFPYR